MLTALLKEYMFAQDAFVQAKLKERELNNLIIKSVLWRIFLFYMIICKAKKRPHGRFFLLENDILFSVPLARRFIFSLCATITIKVKSKAIRARSQFV